jgi:hypothetical protein
MIYVWIWRSFFGMEVSNNDINVFQRSVTFSRLTEDHAPKVACEINGNPYAKGYYVVHGIYQSATLKIGNVRGFPKSKMLLGRM